LPDRVHRARPGINDALFHVKDGDLERISAFVITAAAHRIEAWRQA